ncbi:hypothetical protein RRG08_060790 [Elysia crispata]|uniref:Uncharacterized protein n=1 Tax=Elysia crispata TaxID=231223 RepID=A0AAE1E9Y5_9GAST|nr:hypothetical protein RRG08_060790 [Elysia crispata]
MKISLFPDKVVRINIDYRYSNEDIPVQDVQDKIRSLSLAQSPGRDFTNRALPRMLTLQRFGAARVEVL